MECLVVDILLEVVLVGKSQMGNKLNCDTSGLPKLCFLRQMDAICIRKDTPFFPAKSILNNVKWYNFSWCNWKSIQ